MVKHILLALCALLWTNAALAQSFPKPPDVAAYTSVTPLYKTNGTQNLAIDPAVTPMPIGSGLTNIPIPSNTGRIQNRAGNDANYLLTTLNGGTGDEAKFRTISDFSHMLPDDPVRNFGQPGTSHLHCFFGAGSANAYSTYKTLRQHALDSVASGTDANGTGYWHPCPIKLNPFGNGKNYALRDNWITIYYSGSPSALQTAPFIPVGLRYVFGFDMDASSPSTQYAWLQTALDTANAAIGHTRYTLTEPTYGTYRTQAGYFCDAAGAVAKTGANMPAAPYYSKYLKMPDGTDPWSGTCGASGTMYIRIDGAECYDGTNLWAPGGYKNVIPTIWDNDNVGEDGSHWVCPYNYYRIPRLTLEIALTHNGFSDYSAWNLSSDIAYRSAHGLTEAQVPNGLTFHTDWLFGWDDNVMRQWETNCIGSMHNVPHTCNSSQINATQALLGSESENGVTRTPQVDNTILPHTLETDGGWMLIPPSWSGSINGMHLHQ